MTVRAQPDGYLLELGRDGQEFAIATMACRSHDDATELAESICANMRKAYWWTVTPVIFGDPDAAERRAQMRAVIAAESQPPRDLVAPAASPEPSTPQPAPMVKFDPDTGQRKSTLSRGPGDGACLNCGERVSAPITCTDGEAILQVAWCVCCGSFHTRDDVGWSVAVIGPPIPGQYSPMNAPRELVAETCAYCELPVGACACVTDAPRPDRIPTCPHGTMGAICPLCPGGLSQ